MFAFIMLDTQGINVIFPIKEVITRYPINKINKIFKIEKVAMIGVAIKNVIVDIIPPINGI